MERADHKQRHERQTPVSSTTVFGGFGPKRPQIHEVQRSVPCRPEDDPAVVQTVRQLSREGPILQRSAFDDYRSLGGSATAVLVQESRQRGICKQSLVVSPLDGWACAFLALRTYSGSCVFALPVRSLKVKGKHFFQVLDLSRIVVLPVVDATAWQCRSVSFRSPLAVRLQLGEWLSMPGLVLESHDAPDTLLRFAAKHAFGHMPRQVFFLWPRSST